MSSQTQASTSKNSAEVFSVSRQSEFFSEDELTKQLGVARKHWPLAAVGELIDNALDACEEAKVAPEIVVIVEQHRLYVLDNGPGIPEEVIDRMCDYETRVSSRVKRRGPSRGKQGNATKCILAMPCVFGGKGSVTIHSRGKSQRIEISVDPITKNPKVLKTLLSGTAEKDQHVSIADLASQLELESTSFFPPGKKGTIWQVDLGSQIECAKGDFWHLLIRYRSLNPHVTFRLLVEGSSWNWSRRTSATKKWTPDKREPAAWHDIESFESLLSGFCGNDQSTGRNRSVREVIQSFAGLSSRAATNEVLAKAGMKQPKLSDLVTEQGLDRERTSRLLEAMQASGKVIKPDALGCIGRNNAIAAVEDLGAKNVRYRKLEGKTSDGLPYVVEACYGDRDTAKSLRISGLNFSSDLREPTYPRLRQILEEYRFGKLIEGVVLFHVMVPAPKFTDRGKTSFTPRAEVKQAANRVLEYVLREHFKAVKQHERSAAAPKKTAHRGGMSRKAAVMKLLPDGIKQITAGSPEFDARSLYYLLRPRILQLSGASKIDQPYFETVVDEYEQQHGLIKGRLRDPRGFLYEPHTGTQIQLGTKQVDGYIIPAHRYQAILYIEKKGLLPLLRHVKIPERYDIAVIAAEGYATRAAQTLLQSAYQRNCKILVMHDADPSGYMIAQKMGKHSGAHKFDFEVIDIGLHLEDGRKMQLETEVFDREYRLPSQLKLSQLEQEYFGGKEETYIKENGKERKRWIGCRRIELNALAANPEKFCEWTVQQLEKHGINSKLVPDASVVTSTAESSYQKQRRHRIHTKVIDTLGVEQLVDDAEAAITSTPFDHVPTVLEDWSSELHPNSWETKTEEFAREAVIAQEDEIAAVVAKLTEEKR